MAVNGSVENKPNANRKIMVLNRKEASIGASVFVVLLFLAFVAGYFWGSWNSSERLTSKLEQEAFADQVSQSVLSMYGTAGYPQVNESSEEEDDTSGTDNIGGEKGENNVLPNIKRLLTTRQPLAESGMASRSTTSRNESLSSQQTTLTTKPNEKENAKITSNKPKSPVPPSKRLQGQLIGFGTAIAAQKFINRLNKRGIKALLKTRTSNSPKGKKIVWYQAVTEPYADRAELERVVAAISKLEKLKGAKIVEI